MNMRTLKRLFKIKPYTYTSGKIKIKSDIKLSEEKVIEIYEIVHKTLQVAYYKGAYQLAKEIFRRLKPRVGLVECRIRRKKISIKISQYC